MMIINKFNILKIQMSANILSGNVPFSVYIQRLSGNDAPMTLGGRCPDRGPVGAPVSGRTPFSEWVGRLGGAAPSRGFTSSAKPSAGGLEKKGGKPKKEKKGKKKGGEEEKGDGKNAAKKAAKKAAKLAKKAQHKQVRGVPQQKQNQAEEQVDENDPCADKFGERELIMSKIDPSKIGSIEYTEISDIKESDEGRVVRVRGRAHMATGKGNNCFIQIRQGMYMIQALMFKGDDISKGMVKYGQKIPHESIVEIKGTLAKAGQEVTSCSIKNLEISIEEVWIVRRSESRLPLIMKDALRRCENQREEDDADDSKKDAPKEEVKQDGKQKVEVVVSQKTRLDNRVLDLRVKTNHAMMRVQSGVCRYFRDFLLDRDFIEIHTPKIIGGASEGGAEVFKTKYFGAEACLAQSPQLYKQMAIAGDLGRVFEIAPVFRAEDSNTNRHLTEYVSMDLEMEFKDHYFEVAQVICDMFIHIFENLNTKYNVEIDTIHEQYPYAPFNFAKSADQVPKYEFKEACKKIAERGVEQDPKKDFSSDAEKVLYDIVKEETGFDFYYVYNYPEDARPFYTMPNPYEEGYTNSYDFFMRGEEIISGAQRCHDIDILTKLIIKKDCKPSDLQFYIDSFKYGCEPHAGGGIGLERVTKLFLGIHNIRKCSLFPRDPKRLHP